MKLTPHLSSIKICKFSLFLEIFSSKSASYFFSFSVSIYSFEEGIVSTFSQIGYVVLSKANIAGNSQRRELISVAPSFVSSIMCRHSCRPFIYFPSLFLTHCMSLVKVEPVNRSFFLFIKIRYFEGTSVCSEWRQPRPFNQYQKSVTLLSNSQTFVQPMNNSVVRAWEMFNSRAYLHQYEKYGLEVDDFIDSFGMVEQMISDYSKICKYWSTYTIGGNKTTRYLSH